MQNYILMGIIVLTVKKKKILGIIIDSAVLSVSVWQSYQRGAKKIFPKTGSVISLNKLK